MTQPQVNRVLNNLTGTEALIVLRDLLHHHPDLVDEAVEAATRVASTVDREAVAEDLVHDADVLGWDELNSRAGPQGGGGYVDPTEAAYELLDETLAVYVDEMRRLMAAGLEEPAQRQCEGILLGLHTLDQEYGDNPIIQYAPDFLRHAIGEVREAWEGAPGGPRSLDTAWMRDRVPGWDR